MTHETCNISNVPFKPSVRYKTCVNWLNLKKFKNISKEKNIPELKVSMYLILYIYDKDNKQLMRQWQWQIWKPSVASPGCMPGSNLDASKPIFRAGNTRGFITGDVSGFSELDIFQRE